jgi:pyruvate,water dikinase
VPRERPGPGQVIRFPHERELAPDVREALYGSSGWLYKRAEGAQESMENHYIRRLEGTGAPVSEVGGKAASLDRLVGQGFPVPSAAAVTADAYRAFVRHAGLEPFLESLKGADLPPADRIDEETERIDRTFLEAPLPPSLEKSIREVAGELLGTCPVAVRSSATAEDLAAASFAGQYRTFLEMKTEDEVLGAVRRCWASLWGPSVRAYRRREGVPEDDLAMGVIIQSMAQADWAGVLFTRDPEGDPEVARVEAVRGLGEALVSGRVTPHDYRVDRATLSVRGRASEPDGQPAFLEELVRLGLRIERRMGSPQDIEWAHAGGALAVLQTRPITVQGPLRPDDDGFDTVPEPGATYTPIGVQEMLPAVLPPLLWTINAPMLDEAFRQLFSGLGVKVPVDAGPFLAIGRFRGRAALNLSLLREAATSMPGGSRAEVERQYLGRVLTQGEEPKPSGSKISRALAGIRAVRVRKRVEGEVELFAEAVDGVLALGVNLPALPVARLLAYRSRVRDLAYRGYAAEVTAAAGAAAAYRALEIALERWVGKEHAPLWAQKVTSGPRASAQAGFSPTLAMWDLYARGLRGDEVCDCLLDGPPETVEARVRASGPAGERFLQAVNRVSRHFGSMAVYAGPTWDEDPSAVWQRIAGIARCEDAGHEASPDVRMETVDAARDDAFQELRNVLRKSWKYRLTRILTGQVVDLRRRLLRKLASDASRFLSLREKAKASLLVLGGEERRLILEAARRLQASGVITEPDQILLLSDSELEEMLLGGEPVSPEEVARRGNALARAEQGDPLPETFEGHPGVEALPALVGEVMHGWAASPGRVHGRARVVRTLAEGRDLAPGEILVARSTDPSWTPLFLVAGGIVLEEGGPLSHAAIVAREFGLPAVLNVKGATRAIAMGEEVQVDGTAGVVTRATREEAA